MTKTLTANADFLEVALDSDAQKIDEVMVVAYGTMRKRDVTAHHLHFVGIHRTPRPRERLRGV